MKIRTTVAALSAALALAASPAAAQQNIVQVASGNPNFETLVQAVQAGDLAGALSGTGPFTVFAPTDAAFDKLPDGALDGLLANRAQLRDVLTYHVVQGELTAAALQGRDYVTALNGDRIPVRVMNGQVMVGNARVVQADVDASNGVIHAIDGVLMPPEPMTK
jgi:uncharacterized surface protein with fasciclin (FAS1) repeats